MDESTSLNVLLKRLCTINAQFKLHFTAPTLKDLILDSTRSSLKSTSLKLLGNVFWGKKKNKKTYCRLEGNASNYKYNFLEVLQGVKIRSI